MAQSKTRAAVVETAAAQPKLRRYTGDEDVPNVGLEMAKLYEEGYTHVRRMPGDLGQILYYSKFYGITIADDRVSKVVADACVSKGRRATE